MIAKAENPDQEPNPDGAKGGLEQEPSPLRAALEDRTMQRTALVAVEQNLESGRFSASELRELRAIVLDRIRGSDSKTGKPIKVGKRSMPRYLSIAARLEALDLKKLDQALDRPVNASAQPGLSVGTMNVQNNFAPDPKNMTDEQLDAYIAKLKAAKS